MAKPRSINMNLADQIVSFDIEEFDTLLRSHGVTLVHYRAMRCPMGLTDRDDSRRPHHEHENCSNGAIYKEAGVVTALFQSNSLNVKLMEMGMIDGSTAVVTLPRFYDLFEGESQERNIVVSPYDRFYLKDVEAEVVNWELVDHNLTGVDRLQYPATMVEDIIDSKGKTYTQHVDYVLENGRVRWIGSRPGQDPKLNKGVVFSIRYRYRPFWYCKQILHEIRVSRADDFVTGERKFKRMPYSILLQREVVFENEQRNRVSDDRDTVEPSSGSFGPK